MDGHQTENNSEGGREETSRKAQTEVDGQTENNSEGGREDTSRKAQTEVDGQTTE